MITLKWDSRQLGIVKGPGVQSALTRAVSKAGGDALRAMRVESSRKIRDLKRFKVNRVNKALTLLFPRGKKELAFLQWTMKVGTEVVPVSEFPTRQVRAGVMATINAGKSVLIKGAFIATMRSGHRGVFFRRGKGRLPIKELFTTRVSDVFANTGFTPEIYDRAQEVFTKSVNRLTPLELAKIRR